MRIANCVQYLTCILCCLILSGCGGASGPKLYPVTGTVKYKDNPVTAATVMFTPETGLPAIGITDDSGDFSLATNNVSGAMAGKGIWTVTAFEDFERPPEIGFQEAGKLAIEGKLPLVVGKSKIPEKYGVGITSGLKMEIGTSKNHFEIILQD